jgi:Ca2+-binding EF-hand superfamily protein
MKLTIPALAVSLSLALASAAAIAAVAPEDYVQRVANSYRAAMQAQDYDGDGIVTRDEARIDLLLSGAFTAIDTDGDERITAEEMDRFLAALPAHPSYM